MKIIINNTTPMYPLEWFDILAFFIFLTIVIIIIGGLIYHVRKIFKNR